MTKPHKALIFGVLGGLIVGSHGILLILLPFEPFMAFDLAIGLAIIWFGVLIAG